MKSIPTALSKRYQRYKADRLSKQYVTCQCDLGDIDCDIHDHDKNVLVDVDFEKSHIPSPNGRFIWFTTPCKTCNGSHLFYVDFKANDLTGDSLLEVTRKFAPFFSNPEFDDIWKMYHPISNQKG